LSNPSRPVARRTQKTVSAISRNNTLKLAGIFLAFAIPSYGAAITVLNSSFEVPIGTIPCLTGFSSNCYFSSPPPTSWMSNSPAQSAGTFQVGATPSPAFNSLVGSPSVAYINGPGHGNGGENPTIGGTLTQLVASTIANTSYLLSVDLGWRNDNSYFVSEADLIVGSTVIKATGSDPSHGGWSTFTATYLAPTAGQSIVIQLLNTGTANRTSQANFDNVNLFIVPEPGTIAMTAFGMAFLMFRFRRKRSI
jgi:hypothetical protein